MNDLSAMVELRRAAQDGSTAVEDARTRRALLHILEDLQGERNAAREARRQWIETVDTISHPMVVHDQDFLVVRANKAYAARTGVEVTALLGQPYWKCFPRLGGPLRGCTDSVSPADGCEEELTLESGETFIARSFPIGDAGAAGRQTLLLFEDVTEAKRAKAALEMSERRFRSLIEGSSDVVYLVDRQGNLQYRSPSATRLLGRSDGEVIGASVMNHLDPDDVPAARRALAEILRAPGSQGEVTARLRCSDGRWINVEIIGTNRLDDPAVRGVILNMRDVTERKYAEQSLRGALISTVEAIAATVETRDPYTAGHQRRVADLAAAIAREMGLPAHEVEGIRFGALIHDLGKLQVPAELLAKPTRLTPLEFELIKTHPQAGYAIVKGIQFPWKVAEMVHQHHERLDGSGYPQGLKGEAIALEARILSVADVVEAMASHRPYRAGLGIDVALKEIEGKRGKWFDPQAVDACLRLFREKGYSLEKG
jgi:PAS domain S-box-containing protein/putative nucleotidyltransferase with HDIG domain